MKIDFKRIEIHSFMSFEDEMFDFSERHGMVLVTGVNNDIPGVKNGSGKSALMNSLLYALFGQLREKMHVENIVNRYVEDKDMRVVLCFSVNDKPYRVIRGMKNGKNSYLDLFCGEDRITKSTIQETQNFIERELIKCDVTVFMRTILLTSDQTYNFYQMKKTDKKEFVERLFDIGVFGDMYDRIHKDLLVLDRDIVSRQGKLATLLKQEGLYAENTKTFESEKIGRVQAAEAKLSVAEAECARVKKLNVSINTEKLEIALAKLNSDETDMSRTVRKLESDASKLKIAENRISSAIDAKESIISGHSKLMSKLCDDCRSIFSDHYRLGSISGEISELRKKMQQLSRASEKTEGELSECEKKLAKVKSSASRISDAISNARSDAMSRVRAQDRAEAALADAKNELYRVKSEKNPYSKLMVECKNGITSETNSISELESRLNILKFAESVVSQDTLRKFIISDLIGLLNNRILKYLTKLGSKYTVKFDSDMDYEFVTGSGSCEFSNFSAGERMRIMVATSFAFRDFMSIRNGLNANILILDEYFDSAIDSTCVENVLEILKDYSVSQDQSIYIISHRQEISQDRFDSVVLVEKTNDISKIAQ